MSFGEIMRSFLSYCLIIAFSVACGAAKNSDREGNSPTGNGDRDNRNSIDPSDQEFQKYAFSQAYRNKANIRLVFVDMVKAIQADTVPLTTYLIPNIEVHVDSEVDGPMVIPSSIENCGNATTSTTTLADRIKSCKDTIPDATAIYWSGKAKGINGEGNWQLVSYSNKMKVWQDTRTGLLWSDIVETSDYEIASGVTVGAIDNSKDRVCQTVADTPRDALGNIHESKVHWRLPNRNEYLQADINGARFVLQNTDQETWTASYAGNSEGWAITQETGVLRKANMIETLKVRCIGVPL